MVLVTMKFGGMLMFIGFLFVIYYFNPMLQIWIAPVIELTLYLFLGVVCEFLGISTIVVGKKKGF